MIPDSVKESQELIDNQLITTDMMRNAVNPRSDIHYLRYRAYCFSELRAEQIVSAMKLLGYDSPEVERSKIFSWDTNDTIDRFLVKCWYPRVKSYEDVDRQIKELVFEGEIT